ncbi:MAG: tRNA (cytidine(56)-2'-O)-methyltransferase, partial [Candidatus Bathyarchaeia archaeon]
QECPVIEEIRKSERDILVIVGSQKVPRSFYSLSVSDYNLAVGNQPHSEIAALAIFLDRLFKGEQLVANFKDARLKILPSLRGKKIIYNK